MYAETLERVFTNIIPGEPLVPPLWLELEIIREWLETESAYELILEAASSVRLQDVGFWVALGLIRDYHKTKSMDSLAGFAASRVDMLTEVLQREQGGRRG